MKRNVFKRIRILSVIAMYSVMLVMSFGMIGNSVIKGSTVTNKETSLPGESCGDTCTWTYDSETKTITIHGTGIVKNRSMSTPVINEAENLIVKEGITCIGDMSLSDLKIKTISLPDSLKEIQDYGFYRCTNVESITIPKGVTKLGSVIFGECTKLKEVTVLGNITSNRATFIDSGIKTLRLAGKCDYIASMVRSEETGPCDVQLINKNPYYKIVKGMMLSKNGKKLYIYNGSKKKVTIPSKVTEIMDSAFSLTSAKIKFNKNLRIIGKNAFYYTQFDKLVIPKNVTTIKEGAFNRANINKVVLNKKLKYIGYEAFGDTTFDSITVFPKTKIANGAFLSKVKVVYKNRKRATGIMYEGYAWDRIDKKDVISVSFNRIKGEAGYEVMLIQKGSKNKIIDVKNKNKVSIKAEYDINSYQKNGYILFNKGFEIYGAVRPYKIVNGKKKYGYWSKRCLFKVDDDGTFTEIFYG